MNLDLAPYFAAEEGIPFRDRWATMPWRNQKPVAPESVDQHWQSILNSRVSGNKRLLYLHIPFCATHCKFCGFYQNKLE
ncbi:MAG: heme anaerobic degradation radical SAM methyltransferase ChuW/HutW, partial [Hafnia alvei]